MIAIIKGCGSNITSIQYALKRLGVDAVLTDDADTIRHASKVILPGVGHAAFAMHTLHTKKIIPVIQSLTQPVLGICLGMQLMYKHSEEDNTTCLGIIPDNIIALKANKTQVIPHMGWHDICFTTEQTLDWKVPIKLDACYCYFVHSYAAPVNAYTLATCEYTQTFTAMVKYKNFIGMQFHPEKSGHIGESLLLNFLQGVFS